MSDLLGKWNIVLDTPVGIRRGTLELHHSAGTLTGLLSDGQHQAQVTGGRIQGNELTWTAHLASLRLNVKFAATLDGERISGTAKHLLGRATFQGVKA